MSAMPTVSDWFSKLQPISTGDAQLTHSRPLSFCHARSKRPTVSYFLNHTIIALRRKNDANALGKSIVVNSVLTARSALLNSGMISQKFERGSNT